jgi:hypothetical protein
VDGVAGICARRTPDGRTAVRAPLRRLNAADADRMRKAFEDPDAHDNQVQKP